MKLTKRDHERICIIELARALHDVLPISDEGKPEEGTRQVFMDERAIRRGREVLRLARRYRLDIRRKDGGAGR